MNNPEQVSSRQYPARRGAAQAAIVSNLCWHCERCCTPVLTAVPIALCSRTTPTYTLFESESIFFIVEHLSCAAYLRLIQSLTCEDQLSILYWQIVTTPRDFLPAALYMWSSRRCITRLYASVHCCTRH
eukprot:scpid38149/ scgid25502/ 